MNTYNKQINYKKYIFNIKVELNVRVEKCIDGKRCHKITINDMGHTNFYLTKEVEDEFLFDTIEILTSEAHKYVDDRGDRTPTEITLEDELGFTR